MRQTLSVDGVTFAVTELPPTDVYVPDGKRTVFEMGGQDGAPSVAVELTSREAQALLTLLSSVAGVGVPTYAVGQMQRLPWPQRDA